MEATHEVSAVVMKNWLPLVFGPALAIERHPVSCCISLKLYLQVEVLVLEFPAVNTFSSSSVSSSEITSLDHEIWDDSMERTSGISETAFQNNKYGTPCAFFPFSPVHRALKFSTVLGTLWPNNPTWKDPASCPSTSTVISRVWVTVSESSAPPKMTIWDYQEQRQP